MDNLIFLPDSANTIRQTIEIVAPKQEFSYFEFIRSSATVLIALVNIGLVYYIFIRNNKLNHKLNENNRKINLFKTLVLDNNMKFLYQYFDEVIQISDKLKVNELNSEEKKKINEKLNDLAIEFRQKFIDTTLAINKSLYEDILKVTDDMIDSLTNSIFDDGVNLSHKPKFNELITTKIVESKTQTIKILFDYSGE